MSAGGQNSKKSSSAPSDPPAVVEHTRHLLSISLADSTKKMYGVGWRSYIQYCATANRKPLPLSEEALMNWASSTALSGCKYTTIKSYLSRIFNKISLVMGKRVAVCGAIDFNARSTSFKRCILTRSAISKPCMIAAERIPDKYDLIVVYLQPLRAVLLAQFIRASSLRGSGLRLAVAQYCM